MPKRAVPLLIYQPIWSKHVCFLILYVDDGLIIGEDEALEYVCNELSKRYKCKWEEPKDYLGMDLIALQDCR